MKDSMEVTGDIVKPIGAFRNWGRPEALVGHPRLDLGARS
jgi:hypothetical protein